MFPFSTASPKPFRMGWLGGSRLQRAAAPAGGPRSQYAPRAEFGRVTRASFFEDPFFLWLQETTRCQGPTRGLPAFLHGVRSKLKYTYHLERSFKTHPSRSR